MVIAIDYDGTIIDGGAYPNKGTIRPDAAKVIKWLKSKGATLILWTCREGQALKNAKELLEENGLEFDAFNENADNYYTSRKIVADIYIDDMAWPRIPIDWKSIGESFGMDGKDFD